MNIQMKISFAVGLLLGIITGFRNLSYLKKQYDQTLDNSKINLINLAISMFTTIIVSYLFYIVIGTIIKILEWILGVDIGEPGAGIVYFTMIWPIAFIFSFIIALILAPKCRKIMQKILAKMLE